MSDIRMKLLKSFFYLTYLVFPLTILSILSVDLLILFPIKLFLRISVIVIVAALNSALFSGLAVCYYRIEEFIQRSSLFEKLVQILEINSNKRLLSYIRVTIIINSMLLMYVYIVVFGFSPIIILIVVLVLINSMLLGWCSKVK